MASKKVNQVNIRGTFDLDTMEIVEQAKEAEYTYDFLEQLRDFDGKNITVSIKEEKELPVKEEL
ncbi:YonK family protein [Cytobacillus kochii]|uniref:YonK family protein n=1 Tax=Cytobacillus kochii TaxID=859143 RepID=UPI001CD5C9BF|nr:YonK family protein [Cytobacillus kochii]MCA1025687.1 YonK family protein [Cytobacillus kochii]